METKPLPIKEQSCCVCGVAMWMTDQMETSLKENAATFYCLNGHGQSFTPSKADRLEKELTQKNIMLNDTKGKLQVAQSYIETLERKLKSKKRKPKK